MKLQINPETDLNKYPLIKALNKDLQIDKDCRFHFYLDQVEIPEQFLDLTEKMLKSESLDEAMQTVFNTKSKVLKHFFYTKCLSENKKRLKFDIEYLLPLFILKNLLLERKEPNLSDFLQIISNPDTILDIAVFPHKKDLIIDLLSNFSDAQIVKILNNSSKEDVYEKVEFLDILNMFSFNKDYYREFIKKTDFKKLDDFIKIHDAFSKENEKIIRESFLLEQEKTHPALSEINGKEIHEGYYFELPKTNHVLIDWGSTLQHCIGSHHYSLNAKTGESILIGVMKDGEVQYTLEIKNKIIVQAQGKSRSAPPSKLDAKIRKMLNEIKIIN